METRIIVTPRNYDPMYNLSENKLLEAFVKKELQKAGMNKSNASLPPALLKRKNILYIIFSILLFVYISLIFFHFPKFTYFIGFVILVVYFVIMQRYNLVAYLKKEIKSRPGEKISNIIQVTKMSAVPNKRILPIACIIAAVVLPMLIFLNPRILYEKVDGGYSVRFYTFGVTNFTTAAIPESHKGEPVVSLRGNCFSNMPFLTSVELADSITEIRGEAFLNDKRLVYVKLPENLAEIKGNTFENCYRLTSIEIPDSVTRIGGHAFYECWSLSNVVFTPDSKLEEIGSSAFRSCPRLYSVTLPSDVSINSRAFKDSPTDIGYFE